MTVLDDLKKIRRTRWSRLNWPIDCPMLASRLAETSNAEDGRAALSEALAAVEAYLVSEGNLIRYSHCARAVLSALLGLGDTAERGADERYETASRIASVPVATLKTRDGNLLLDAFARALTVEWQLAQRGRAPAEGHVDGLVRRQGPDRAKAGGTRLRPTSRSDPFAAPSSRSCATVM